jgi:hypothetical protein
VLADLLGELGDPRGELIALQLAARADDAIDLSVVACIARHPELAPRFVREGARWGYGHWRSLRFGPAGVELQWLPQTLAHAAARFLIELALDHDPGLPAAIAAIGRTVLPALRVLAIGPTADVSAEQRSTLIGDVAPLWAAMPRLAHLTICGRAFPLGTLDLPMLTDLRLETTRLPSANLYALAQSALPSLARCGVWIGVQNGASQALEPLERWLTGDLPALLELALVNTSFTHSILELFVRLPITRRLRALALPNGTLDGRSAELLLRHRDVFGHLDLDLSENAIGFEEERVLRAELPRARVVDQRDGYEPEPYDY